MKNETELMLEEISAKVRKAICQDLKQELSRLVDDVKRNVQHYQHFEVIEGRLIFLGELDFEEQVDRDFENLVKEGCVNEPDALVYKRTVLKLFEMSRDRKL